MLTNFLMVVVAAAFTAGGYTLGRRMGQREGEIKTLDQLRKELDNTIVEWNTRATAGEVSRSMELPGLHAVRRMLGAKL